MIEITREILDRADWKWHKISDICRIPDCNNQSIQHLFFRYTHNNTPFGSKEYLGVCSYCKEHALTKGDSYHDYPGGREEYQELTPQELFYARLLS